MGAKADLACPLVFLIYTTSLIRKYHVILRSSSVKVDVGFSSKDLIMPNTSLFIALIGITEQPSRRNFAYKNWVTELHQFTNHKVIFEVEPKEDESQEIKTICIPPLKSMYSHLPVKKGPDYDRARRRISGLKYFLENINFHLLVYINNVTISIYSMHMN